MIMPYNQITVVLGGLMHIPVIILVLRFIENRFNNRNWTNEELNYNKILEKLGYHACQHLDVIPQNCGSNVYCDLRSPPVASKHVSRQQYFAKSGLE